MSEETKANPGAQDPGVPPDLVELGVYPRERDAFERGLVVLSLGGDFWLLPGETGWRLLAEPAVERQARRQIAYYDRETVGWPPKPPTAPLQVRRADFLSPLLWVLLTLWLYREQGLWAGELEKRAALDTAALFDRAEWWRPFSALFLHGDLGHLCSNIASGYFAFATMLASFGRLRGWLLLLGASVLANTCVAALYYPGPYRSLGASTAIFAALGMLTGSALPGLRGSRHPQRWRHLFAPILAGLGLLALFGSGGQNTDLAAHLYGFGWGLVAGALGRPKP